MKQHTTFLQQIVLENADNNWEFEDKEIDLQLKQDDMNSNATIPHPNKIVRFITDESYDSEEE